MFDADCLHEGSSALLEAIGCISIVKWLVRDIWYNERLNSIPIGKTELSEENTDRSNGKPKEFNEISKESVAYSS